MRQRIRRRYIGSFSNRSFTVCWASRLTAWQGKQALNELIHQGPFSLSCSECYELKRPAAQNGDRAVLAGSGSFPERSCFGWDLETSSRAGACDLKEALRSRVCASAHPWGRGARRLRGLRGPAPCWPAPSLPPRGAEGGFASLETLQAPRRAVPTRKGSKYPATQLHCPWMLGMVGSAGGPGRAHRLPEHSLWVITPPSLPPGVVLEVMEPPCQVRLHQRSILAPGSCTVHLV